jgi:hypothetical protein
MSDAGQIAGGKATGQAEVSSIIKDLVPHAIVLPFGVYYKHVKDSGIYDYIKTALTAPDVQGDSPEALAKRTEALAVVRKRIAELELQPYLIEYLYKALATEPFSMPITKNGKVWTPNPDGRLAGDVWRFPTLAGKRFADEKVAHPTQKPLSISERIVQHFSEEGKTVLIPFSGSGSECVAAKKLGRNFLACDINSDYVQLARERLKSL